MDADRVKKKKIPDINEVNRPLSHSFQECGGLIKKYKKKKRYS